MADAHLTLSGTASTAERAAAYRWLASLFAVEPTPQAIAVYRTDDGQALLDALQTWMELAPPVGALRERVAQAAPGVAAEMVARNLAAEFAWLFHGVGGRSGAPPCASFYRAASERMMQEPAGAMDRELADLGLSLAASMREPPDHVAVQLAVMAHLLDMADHDAQRAFAERHLAPWLGDFSARCARTRRAPFYAAAARAAAAFCEADLARLPATST